MRSIRLSLVVYFLLLMSVALGVIGWLAYQATARTLRDKEEATRGLLIDRYQNSHREIGEQYDRSIEQRAHTLARLAEQQPRELVWRELAPVGWACNTVNLSSQFVLPFCLGLLPD